jgi:hypothetical protein
MSTRKPAWRERRARGATVVQALGILVAYFGVVVALMYPVADAAGYLV